MATSLELLAALEDLEDGEFKKFKWFLQHPEALEGFPAIPKSQLEHLDRMDTVDEITETYNQNAVEVTIKVLKMIKKNDLVQRLININPASKEMLTVCQTKLKSSLRKKFQHLFDQATQSGKQTLMNEIYTELWLTEEKSEEVNAEQDDKHTRAENSKRVTLEETLNIENIFEAIAGHGGSVRTLMTKGVSGSGKTILTRKFALDWAEDKVNNNIQFIFPFTFRELSLLEEKNYNWVELLHRFFPDTKEAGICSFDKLQIVFILDGLEECQFPLDFHNNEILTDITDKASVDVLLTNLIIRKLFPSSCLWITAIPEAASQIPCEYIHMVTEVGGFTDLKKAEYIRKKLRNKKLANRIISEIKASRRLNTMCQIPVFCLVTTTVLEDLLEGSERGEVPKTLTEMFANFLLVQSNLTNASYVEAEVNPVLKTMAKKMILSVGKLAFRHLQNGNSAIHEPYLTECGIDFRSASVYSGMFSQIFKEEQGRNQERRLGFFHSSLQEFLAAVYVFVSFVNSGVNLLSEDQSTSAQSALIADQSAVTNLFQSAIDKALRSKNKRLDLFLRFLVGLSELTSHAFLQGLLKTSGSNLESRQDIVQDIKRKIRQNPAPDQCNTLLHCLNELNDPFVIEEIQECLRLLNLSQTKLSPAQWSNLVFILLSSDSELNEFDLKKLSASEEGFLRLLPVVQASSRSLLSYCKLSLKACEVLASVLSSQSCNLRELDLSFNSISKGIKELTAGLKNPTCRIETLRLVSCNLTSYSCKALASVLSSQTSSLRELDLSSNSLLDVGTEGLSSGLESPHCRLETLKLIDCALTWKSCDTVAFLLSSNSSSLRHLDLSMNKLEDSGVLVFSAGMESQHCKLETLRLRFCSLSEKSCPVLASVLSSQNCILRELDLSNNNLEDSGARLLSAGIEGQHCNLETLRLRQCKLSEGSCEALTSLFRSQSSTLRELDLSNNDLQDSGVKLLSAGLESTRCMLETLRLSGCQVTDEGCSSLASALSSNPSHLRELDLSYNHPGDSGAMLLSAGLEHAEWKLDTLKLEHGGVQRLKSGLLKYACELTLDPNTAHRSLVLSEDNKKVECVKEEQHYRYHPDRFACLKQLLCREALTGRCYWEVETKNSFNIALTYQGINRRARSRTFVFGRNGMSWSLYFERGLSVWHNNTATNMCNATKDTSSIGVYLDWPAGMLSYYSVTADKLTHLHTFYSRFTEPLYPGFGFDFGMEICKSSVSLLCADDVNVSQKTSVEF